MKVILSKYAGFCFGVTRAIEMIEKAARDKKNQPLFMLGSLVHNEEVVARIKKLGVKVVKNISDVPDGQTVVLSAHGSPPSIYAVAKKKKLKVIDSICPYVMKVHSLGRVLAKEKYLPVVVGDQKHIEVIGIVGSIELVGNKVYMIEDQAQVDVKRFAGKKVGIVSQTTQDLENFQSIVNKFLEMTCELRIFNTICDATRFRQKYALDLAKKVDVMVIVGSFTSANTKRLTKICTELVPTYQVEKAKDLKTKWFEGAKKVGVSAGASTPDSIIGDVVERLEKMNN
ncbi:4-hydroxy-3-methylbut-2-enyl diphosphate reductase [Patescibacteria group bacterium]|nr:4-hydroxy-3-methylbut-2-enyl diphosphate reductase [Patescibacteria group bacterium]